MACIYLIHVMYRFECTTDDKANLEVKTWFQNPYTDRKVHFVICPSHQVHYTTICNACMHELYACSSRTWYLLSRERSVGGTRDFVKGGHSFGWKVVEDMYKREVKRMSSGQVARVPKLKESHIVRDSWTRLNVLPSKVLQVRNLN